MALEQQIMSALKEAMLSKNEIALRGLRAIKSAILLAKTADGKQGEISEEDELKLLQKLAKQRKDSIEIFLQQNRNDLATKEQDELAIIEQFLPKQMDESELRSVLQSIIQDSGASTAADMGKVMGVATKQLAGKADGKMISTIVKELLA
ncbi:MAG: GatB/YqeY domain-containing protein [Chitinophagaceae bacterium]